MLAFMHTAAAARPPVRTHARTKQVGGKRRAAVEAYLSALIASELATSELTIAERKHHVAWRAASNVTPGETT
jgi:hypothetical protein